MLHKTRGIAIHSIKYSETSIVAKIYTQAFGMQSYLINGVRKAKSNYSAVLFEPLTLIDMVVYNNQREGLQRVSEVKMAQNHEGISLDPRKILLAQFMAEVLRQCLQQEENDDSLFNFLYQTSIVLNDSKSTAGFELWFLLQLSVHLGFNPAQPGITTDLSLVQEIENYGIPLTMAEQLTLRKLHDNIFTPLAYGAANQLSTVQKLLEFYAHHINNFNKINSLSLFAYFN